MRMGRCPGTGQLHMPKCKRIQSTGSRVISCPTASLYHPYINCAIGFRDTPKPSRTPFSHWKWPLTHKERIEELEDILKDDRLDICYPNVKAAIRYHQGFDENAECDHTLVYFQDGRQLESHEFLNRKGQSSWVEVRFWPRSLFYSTN